MHQEPPDLSDTAPKTRAEWDLLHTKPKNELLTMGCRMWNKSLCLFPFSWFEKIPEGFAIVSISGEESFFSKKTTDNDYRFGVLAYGVVLTTSDANE